MMRSFVMTGLGLLAMIAAAPAQLVVAEPLYDFGTLDQGASFEGSFSLRHDGSKPIRLTDIDYACDCATGSLPADIMAPGAAAELSFSFSTRGLEGSVKKAAILTWVDADGKSRTTDLAIAGVVVPAWKIPTSVALGEVEPGETVTRRIPVEFRGDERRTLVCRDAAVEIETNDEGCALVITFQAPDEPGRFGRQFVVTADDEHKPSALVYLVGSVKGDIAVTPEVLVLDADLARLGGTVEIVFESRTKKPFALASASDPSPLGVDVPKADGVWRRTVIVHVPAKGLGRGQRGRMRFSTDRPDQPRITVTWEGP